MAVRAREIGPAGGGLFRAAQFSADGYGIARYDCYQATWFDPTKPVGKGWDWCLKDPDNVDMVANLPLPSAEQGGHAAAIAYNDSTHQACIVHGILWTTNNRWTTVTRRTAAPTMDNSYVGNAALQAFYQRLMYDPINSDVLTFSDFKRGVYYSLDHFATSAGLVTGVPAPLNNGGCDLRFDPSSTPVSGRSGRAVAWSNGNGLYQTTTAIVGTFSQIAGSPLVIMEMQIDAAGAIWTSEPYRALTFTGALTAATSGNLTAAWSGNPDANPTTHYVRFSDGSQRAITTTNGSTSVTWTGAVTATTSADCWLSTLGDGRLRRYQSGAWVTVDAVLQTQKMAVHPTDATKFYATKAGGNPRLSVNATSATPTFTSFRTNGRSAIDAPWLQNTNEIYMTTGTQLVDPTDGNLMSFEGIGIWKMLNSETQVASNTTVTWTWHGGPLGLGSLIGMQVKTHWTTGTVYISDQDRAHHVIPKNRIGQDPLGHGPDYTSPLSHGNTTDWSPNLPGFVVNACWRTTGNRGSGWSAKDGRPGSWNPWSLADHPQFGGNTAFCGSIAATGGKSAVWSPTNNFPVWWSADVTVPLPFAAPNGGYVDFGATANPYMQSQAPVVKHNAYTIWRQHVVADKVDIGTAYIYVGGDQANAGSAADLATRGMWRIVAGVATRLINTRLNPSNYDVFNGSMKQTPFRAGNFVWCTGTINGSYNSVLTAGLLWTSDGWVSVPVNITPSIGNIISCGFGKAAPGQSHPVIGVYATGGPSGRGFYTCEDFNPASPATGTWVFQTRFIGGHIGLLTDLDGDMTEYGNWYFIGNTGLIQLNVGQVKFTGA